MDRRVGGIALLILALLAAAVVPNIATKVIPGRPIAAPVPGPPDVGACVTSVPPVSIFDDSGSRYLRLPSMKYGTCAATHYGEITAVLPDLPLQKNPFSSNSGENSADQNDPATACSTVAPPKLWSTWVWPTLPPGMPRIPLRGLLR